MRRATVGVSAITAAAVACLVGCIPVAPPPPPPTSPFGLVPTPAGPPTVAVKDRRSVSDVQVNICNGEAVQLTGELSEESKVKDSKAEQRIKAHLTGFGDLGNEYKLELDLKSKWDTASMTMTVKNRYVLESKGPAPDQRVTVNISSSPLSLKLDAECH